MGLESGLGFRRVQMSEPHLSDIRLLKPAPLSLEMHTACLVRVGVRARARDRDRVRARVRVRGRVRVRVRVSPLLHLPRHQ